MLPTVQRQKTAERNAAKEALGSAEREAWSFTNTNSHQLIPVMPHNPKLNVAIKHFTLIQREVSHLLGIAKLTRIMSIMMHLIWCRFHREW
jgi:hypothetical protein